MRHDLALAGERREGNEEIIQITRNNTVNRRSFLDSVRKNLSFFRLDCVVEIFRVEFL